MYHKFNVTRNLFLHSFFFLELNPAYITPRPGTIQANQLSRGATPPRAMAQAAVGSADGTEAPLLPSSAAGTPPPQPAGAPRWNWFAFVCATLASVTTMLNGYST
jgi:hypothetical protein